MRIAYTEQQADLRRELRAYFAVLMNDERRAALSGGDGELGEGDAYRDVVAQMGSDGWLALGWPTEFGGQNRSMMDQLIFTDEAAVAKALDRDLPPLFDHLESEIDGPFLVDDAFSIADISIATSCHHPLHRSEKQQ